MSCQKGNVVRSRPQKHQNQHAFKNDLHDKSRKTKSINEMQVGNVCERCKQIIEWKIKYKKYKPLKAPTKCTKCELKAVKHSYHTICEQCAKQFKICSKCLTKGSMADATLNKEEQLKLDRELQDLLKSLSERKRRTFLRFVNKENKNQQKKGEKTSKEDEAVDNDKHKDMCQKDILDKLKVFAIKEKENEDDDEYFDDSSHDEFS